MYCSFYLSRGLAFVPTMARTEAGYWLAAEPVVVQRVETVETLQNLLLDALARGNPTVPTPARRSFPRPVMERCCGEKSLAAFERTATCWSVSRDACEYRIYEWRRSARYRGAREQDRESEIRLPVETPVVDVARLAAETALFRAADACEKEPRMPDNRWRTSSSG